MSDELLLKPVPHEEAAAWIADKPVVAREVFRRLLPELRARAFVVSGLESASLLQAIRDRLADVLQGADWDAVKDDVSGILGGAWLGRAGNEEEEAAIMAAARRRAELLLRTHCFQAYQVAQYHVMRAQQDAMPYWQYLTFGDERVRPGHAALNGLVLPADSPFWKDHFPPWEWNCRCQVVPLSQADVDEIRAGKADGRELSDVQRKALEQSGRIADPKTGQVQSVLPQSGDGAFRFDPESLRLPVDDLAKRYDPDVWSKFRAWAEETAVSDDGKVSVWEWMNGQDIILPPDGEAGEGDAAATTEHRHGAATPRAGQEGRLDRG